jgi:hypothetical protein
MILNHSKCDFHSPHFHSFVVEDKTTSDGTHLYSELPVSSAMESLSDSQIISIAETVLSHCSREHDQRPMSDANKCALDTADNPPLTGGGLSRTQKTGGPVFSELVAEDRYDIHEMSEIKEAIEDYYS